MIFCAVLSLLCQSRIVCDAHEFVCHIVTMSWMVWFQVNSTGLSVLCVGCPVFFLASDQYCQGVRPRYFGLRPEVHFVCNLKVGSRARAQSMPAGRQSEGLWGGIRAHWFSKYTVCGIEVHQGIAEASRIVCASVLAFHPVPFDCVLCASSKTFRPWAQKFGWGRSSEPRSESENKASKVCLSARSYSIFRSKLHRRFQQLGGSW